MNNPQNTSASDKPSANQVALIGHALEQMQQHFHSVLPPTIKAERFIAVAKTAVAINPDLQAVDRRSLYLACQKAAQDGLLPDGREAALVVYNTKQRNGGWAKIAQYIPMIQGIVKKLYGHGGVTSVIAHVVRENDDFDYALGDNPHISHVPARGNRGDVIGAYAIFKRGTEEPLRDFMSLEEISKIMGRSRSKDKDGNITGPWKTDFEEMAKKTVIKRLAKSLSLTPELDAILRRDWEAEEALGAGEESPALPQPVNRRVSAVQRIVDAESAPAEAAQEQQPYYPDPEAPSEEPDAA